MFLLVPAYPGCPGQMAVKWLLLLLLSSLFTVIVCTRHIVCSALCVKQFTVVTVFRTVVATLLAFPLIKVTNSHCDKFSVGLHCRQICKCECVLSVCRHSV